jgi:hypothetical protein
VELVFAVPDPLLLLLLQPARATPSAPPRARLPVGASGWRQRDQARVASIFWVWIF